MKIHKGKIALVSGGSGSIGGAICRELAKDGANVMICDIFLEKGQALQQEIIAAGGKAEAICMNVTDEADVRKAFSYVIEKYGRLDILVNVAGGSARDRIRDLADQSMEVIDDILNVNLRGALMTMREAAIQMRKQMSGCIINVTSIVGLQGKKGHVDYAAAKAGLIAASKSLAIEMGKYNVNVNCVAPGLVPRAGTNSTGVDETNLFKRLCMPEEIAYMVEFLTQDKASFITGQNYVVDGGRSIGLRGDKA